MKRKSILYIFAIICLLHHAKGWATPSDSVAIEKAIQTYLARDYYKAWAEFDKLAQNEQTSARQRVEAYSFLGRTAFRLKLGADSARYYMKKTLQLCEENALQNEDIYFRSVRDHARYFYWDKMYDSALYYMHSALPYLTEQVSLKEHTFFYEQLFVLYYTKDKYWTARDYLLKAEEYISKRGSLDQKHLIRHLHNKIYMFQSIKAFDEARKVYLELLAMSPDIPHYLKNNGYNQSFMHKSIADSYLKSATYDEAIIYAEKALNNLELSGQEDPLFESNIVQTLAKAYEGIGRNDKARKLFEENLQRIETHKLENTYSVKTESYRGLARLSAENLQFEEALDYLNQAEQIYKDSYFLSTGDLQSGKNKNKVQLIKIKWEKGKILKAYYEQTNDFAFLNQASEHYMQAVRLMVLFRQESFSDQDKIQHIENYFDLYEETLQCLYEEYSKNKALHVLYRVFEVMENSQSALLADHRNFKSTKSGQLLKKEDSLYTQRSELLRKAELKENDSLVTQGLSNINIQLKQLNWQFTNQFIHTDMKAGELISEIQNQLSKESAAFLSYFISDEALYIFTLEANDKLFRRIPLSKDFFMSLNVFKSALYSQSNEHKLRFKERYHAYALYEKLIKPIEEYIADKELLIISRTGEMNYIPFDALVSNENVNASYLLEKYRVHYVFSAQDWFTTLQKESKERQGYKVLAMAPFSPGKELDQPIYEQKREYLKLLLPASLKEVLAVSQTPQAGKQATKESFMEQARQHQIIHLATHAKADPAAPLSSHILFYPKDSLTGFKLYSHEIMNMDLDQAQLVVLSACQTGDGKLQKGEGLMSLARSFAYAGVSNVIMSLWNADDEATAYILQRFYFHLKQGKGKAESLRQAKLDYVNNPSFDPYSQNPVYWANLQLIGNDEKLYQDPQHHYLQIVLMGLLVVSSFGFVFIRLKKRRNQPLEKKVAV